MNLPRNRYEWGWLAARAIVIGTVIAVLWVLTSGCKTVERPAVAIAGAAVSASNVMATADTELPKVTAATVKALESVSGLSAALSNEVAKTGPELRETLIQARASIATLTNVTRSISQRVDTSNDRAKARGEAMQELWNTLKPYIVAAAIALLLAVKRYGFGEATVPDDVKKMLTRKPKEPKP